MRVACPTLRVNQCHKTGQCLWSCGEVSIAFSGPGWTCWTVGRICGADLSQPGPGGLFFCRLTCIRSTRCPQILRDSYRPWRRGNLHRPQSQPFGSWHWLVTSRDSTVSSAGWHAAGTIVGFGSTIGQSGRFARTPIVAGAAGPGCFSLVWLVPGETLWCLLRSAAHCGSPFGVQRAAGLPLSYDVLHRYGHRRCRSGVWHSVAPPPVPWGSGVGSLAEPVPGLLGPDYGVGRCCCSGSPAPAWCQSHDLESSSSGQFVTSLNRMSSEVLRLAIGSEVFPSAAVDVLSPVPWAPAPLTTCLLWDCGGLRVITGLCRSPVCFWGVGGFRGALWVVSGRSSLGSTLVLGGGEVV